MVWWLRRRRSAGGAGGGGVNKAAALRWRRWRRRRERGVGVGATATTTAVMEAAEKKVAATEGWLEKASVNQRAPRRGRMAIPRAFTGWLSRRSLLPPRGAS